MNKEVLYDMNYSIMNKEVKYSGSCSQSTQS